MAQSLILVLVVGGVDHPAESNPAQRSPALKHVRAPLEILFLQESL